MTTTTKVGRTNINSLSLAERRLDTRKMYSKESYFFEIFNRDHFNFFSPEHTNNFRHEVLRLLLAKKVLREPIELEEIHNHIPQELKDYNFEDGVNKISTFLYETDEQFQQIYFHFIRNLRQTFLHEEFLFQAVPTIRIHCPNAANSHHYPRYHTDISYGHPPDEVNLWIPLTEPLGGHGFKIMSIAQSNMILSRFDYDQRDFIDNAIHNKTFSNECDAFAKEVNTPFNSFLAFDARSIHSGVPLKNHTRVSMDIRLISLSQYKKLEYCYQGLGRRKVFFAPGHCYNALSSDHI